MKRFREEVSRTRVQFPTPTLTQFNNELQTKLNFLKQTNRRYRGKNNLEGNPLARSLVRDIPGKLLIMVYMKVKHAGLQLRVHKFDGKLSLEAKDKNDLRINVEVSEGSVRKAWIG